MTFKDLQKLVHSKPNTESNALFDRLCIPYHRIIGALFLSTNIVDYDSSFTDYFSLN
jgi:hypothetical protein